jgi:methylated-DNA-[protein]-cysteine S-methyltransferase
MPALIHTTIDSPIGELLLKGDGRALTGLYMSGGKFAPAIFDQWERDDDAFGEVRAQLGAYFAGELTEFDVPMAPAGTAFQLSVWKALGEIPYGTTQSYGQLAARVGNVRACRAVGLANGRNPISIIVPCHRVIGASGTLTGYGGGLERKRQLLDLETGVLSAARAA